MTKILVTGATGMLGATLVPWLIRCGHEVLRHGFRGEADYHADLRDYAPTAAMLDLCAPHCIINLAALTDVDACERSPDAAYRSNVSSVEHLSRWIRDNRTPCHLIQISTDQLYDGEGPHRESSISICNTYAFSKRACELAAAAVPCTVLRTNFFGHSRCRGRTSFSDWIYESSLRELPISLFDDILFSPLSLSTLSEMIERVVRRMPEGVFNVGGAAGLSKADFAYEFANSLDLPTAHMQRVQSIAATRLLAYRPKDMRMDCGLFEQIMGLRLPRVADEIMSARSEYLELT